MAITNLRITGRRHRSTAGFTLVEAMMVVVIIGIIVLIGPTILRQTVRFYQLHAAKIEIQRDARAALDIVNRFLRQARSYSVVVDQISGQPPFSRVSFTTVDGLGMSFYQTDNTLFMVGNSTTTLCKNLRYIAFTFPRSDDPSIISVAMTMEKSTYEGGLKALELSIEKVRIMN